MDPKEKARNIEAILLDVGNTLRIVIKDEKFMADAKQQMVDLTGSQMEPEAFFQFLENRYQVLRKRAKERLIEASEKEMWTQWMLLIILWRRSRRTRANSPGFGGIATAAASLGRM
jgi:hypothetical protein